MRSNIKHEYYLKIKDRVEAYCKDLRKKLQVFPQKILRSASHLDIPEDEMMYYKNNSYSLKTQVKDCLKIYKFLEKKTRVVTYAKYFNLYKKNCQGKKNEEEIKTAYNTTEMELIKEFNAQRDLLYRAVTVMKALTVYLKKKDGKEEKQKTVEEYVDDILNMDDHFTEKPEFDNHHFIPTDVTMESFKKSNETINIIPGKGVDKITFNMTHSQVVSKLGEPKKTKKKKGKVVYAKYDKYAIFYDKHDGKILYINIKPKYKILIKNKEIDLRIKSLKSELGIKKLGSYMYGKSGILVATNLYKAIAINIFPDKPNLLNQMIEELSKNTSNGLSASEVLSTYQQNNTQLVNNMASQSMMQNMMNQMMQQQMNMQQIAMNQAMSQSMSQSISMSMGTPVNIMM